MIIKSVDSLPIRIVKNYRPPSTISKMNFFDVDFVIELHISSADAMNNICIMCTRVLAFLTPCVYWSACKQQHVHSHNIGMMICVL